MGIFSWLRPGQSPSRISSQDLCVNLSGFACGRTPLGATPSANDAFSQHLAQHEILKCEREGFELGTEDGKLDYVFLTLSRFRGSFTFRGDTVALTTETTPEQVLRRFGDPYWKDEDRNELILFYEDGRVELQFEFPGKHRLSFVTMMLNPLMADAEQRKAYGVTKPWPPH